MPKKVSVTIMVKNESAIIERCLRSVLNIADLVIITDTGSTDDTIIKAGLFLQNNKINYKIYIEPFKDFATNRNRLLELAAQEPIDYVLQLDADEVFDCSQIEDISKWKENLNGDYYDVILRAGTMIYNLPRMTYNGANLRYEGVTHEYLKIGGFYGGILPDLKIIQVNDSKRRVTNNKFQDDIKLLEKALKSEQNDNLRARYIFYLAQTYQAVGEYDKAKDNYFKRSTMGGWKEEIFYCFYQIGRIMELQNDASCCEFYIRAYDIMPTRIESLAALRDYRLRQGYDKFATILQEKINQVPAPLGGLFIEEDKYAQTISKPI